MYLSLSVLPTRPPRLVPCWGSLPYTLLPGDLERNVSFPLCLPARPPAFNSMPGQPAVYPASWRPRKKCTFPSLFSRRVLPRLAPCRGSLHLQSAQANRKRLAYIREQNTAPKYVTVFCPLIYFIPQAAASLDTLIPYASSEDMAMSGNRQGWFSTLAQTGQIWQIGRAHV